MLSNEDNSEGNASSSSSLVQSTLVNKSQKKRVITTPAWARNLPPDEFPDDNLPFDRRTSSNSAFSNSNNNNNNNNSISPPPPQTSSPTSSNHIITPTILTQPLPTYIPQSTSGAGSAVVDKWWTFTIPSKYGDKVRDYVHHHGHLEEKGKLKEETEEEVVNFRDGESSGSSNNSQKEMKEKEKRFSKEVIEGTDLEKGRKEEGAHIPANYLSMGARLAPGVFSANQTLTPGWSAPWAPFRRETSRDDEYNTFRFSEDTPVVHTKMSKTRTFVLENVFAPLVFRFFNLSANICTLGIAGHMRIQEQNAGLPGVMGSSTLMAVCISPLALVHIFVTLYVEYFGRPIGLWAISTKMFHTLTELIFICLWSSVFSLALDDLFSTPLQCTSLNSLYNQSVSDTAGFSFNQNSLASSLCGQQAALIVMIFGSLTLCAAVLVVSLFRIFARVSKKH